MGQKYCVWNIFTVLRFFERDCSGWQPVAWSQGLHSQGNVARPCFLLSTDPAVEKLGITSLSAVVQWDSCRTMMKVLFLLASWSITLIFFAVSPVFSWSMLDRGSPSTAALLLPCLAPGVFLPNPRWTHLARVAVVALVVTGLVDICSNVV